MLLLSFVAEATHIVGGEIYYDNLGNNNYKIQMKVYRDCLNGVPPFDNPAFITIFDASANVVTTLQVAINYSITVPPSNNSPCAPTASGNACVEEAYYEAIVNLPPLIGGYYIAYQRCCRNGTILNLVNPGDVGTTYWEHIPGPEVVSVNSSPRFTYRPPIYVCANLPIFFNHVATDPDGDSLVYSLCTPYNGLDACCPLIGTAPQGPTSQCPSPPPSCPTANTPPPYIGVPFSAPYSASYPMASNPAININPQTGFLNGNPTIQGQWVVGVCVEEYRNGILIGTHHRDFQFNVIPCPFVVAADIVGQTTTNNGQGTGYCNGFTISFANNSYNGTTYHWDFGDPSTLADTSNLYNPTYTFPAPGVYTVTLIVNPGSNCGDTAYKVFQVYPLLSPDYLAPSSQCFLGNSFNFNGGGQYQGNGTFTWNFGSNATPQTANTASVSNVVFNAPGTYSVSFTVAENGCTATVTKTIEVWQNPIADIGNFTTGGCVPLTVTFTNQSTAASGMSFLWEFGDGSTSTQQNPTYTYTQTGVYTITLTAITNQQCIDTSKVSSVSSITVVSVPDLQLNVLSPLGQCFDNHSYNFLGTTQAQGTYSLNWDFGLNATPQTASVSAVSNVIYNAPGTYTVSFSVNQDGCLAIKTQTIDVWQNTIADIGSYPVEGCDPLVVTFTNQSTASSSMNYLWTFSDGGTSTSANPTHIFTPPGNYGVSLTVISTGNCEDTSIVSTIHPIVVYPKPDASFSVSYIDADIQCLDLSSNDVEAWHYNFGDGQYSTSQNPSHTYTQAGTFEVVLIVTNQFGCTDTTKAPIESNPVFVFWIPNAFTPKKPDGLNDIFKPIVIGVDEYTFTIFDRWGEKIYETHDLNEGWDGTYKNNPCQQDVYVWKCNFRNMVSGEHESHVGHVTLLK